MKKQQPFINRRQTLIGSSAVLLIASTPPVVAQEASMRDAMRTLAGKLFYSKEKPGRWKGKENGHIPRIKINKDGKDVLVRAATGHSMTPEHHIIKHMLMDADMNFISEQYFDLEFDNPRSRFELSGYSGRLFILSSCNRHDIWINWTTV